MSDAALFVGFFSAILVVRIVVATLVFILLIPRTDRCPHCDAVTLRVQSPGWNRLMPWFRSSWCYHCGWEGMLRHPDASTLRSDRKVAAQRAAKARGKMR